MPLNDRDPRTGQRGAPQAHEEERRHSEFRARARSSTTKAIVAALDAGRLQAYVCDFPTNALKDHPKVVTLPHLGASTDEAEDNCAVMVADTVRDFLENGNIKQQRELSRKRAAARAQDLAHLHRQQQRAQHGRPDLDRASPAHAQHRRPAEQVARRIRLHAHRHRWRGRRRT